MLSTVVRMGVFAWVVSCVIGCYRASPQQGPGGDGDGDGDGGGAVEGGVRGDRGPCVTMSEGCECLDGLCHAGLVCVGEVCIDAGGDRGDGDGDGDGDVCDPGMCPEPSRMLQGVLMATTCCSDRGRCGAELNGECNEYDYPGRPAPDCPELSATLPGVEPCCRADGLCGQDLSVVGLGCSLQPDPGRVPCEP